MALFLTQPRTMIQTMIQTAIDMAVGMGVVGGRSEILDPSDDDDDDDGLPRTKKKSGAPKRPAP